MMQARHTVMIVGLLLVTLTVGSGATPGTQDILGDLMGLAKAPEGTALKGLGTEEILALYKNRASKALALLKTYEEKNPASPDLNGARAAALSAVGHTEDEETHTAGVDLAKQLLAAAPKGSDYAAQARLYLLGREYHRLMKDVNSAEDLRKVYDRSATKMRDIILNYVAEYPKYQPAADAFRIVARLAESMDDHATRDAIAAAVARNFPEHSLARILRREKSLGMTLDFAFTPHGAGKPGRLAEWRGKVVVLNFWASWCTPCRGETTRLKNLYARHHGAGLEILGINVDETLPPATKYLAEVRLPWKQFLGSEARKLAEEWGIESLPHQIVIDRKGKIRSTDAVGKLEDLLPELLAEKD